MPAAEQVNVVEALTATVFAVSPESVIFTFDGGAAREVINAGFSNSRLHAQCHSVKDYINQQMLACGHLSMVIGNKESWPDQWLAWLKLCV